MLKTYLLKLYMVAIAICCTAIFVTSCKDDEEAVPVSDVTLDDPALLLVQGQKQRLKALIVPEDATNKAVTWQSSSTAVATVNEAGQVEAKSIGTATITVTTADGGKTTVCEVTVQKAIVSVAGISFGKTELPLLVGEKETLAAIIAPADATIKEVKWKSSNEAVATVSATGEVEAKSVGTATITVTTVDGEKTATCLVTVDASEFAVKFETNGGNKMNDVIVHKGNTLAQPATPTKAGGPGEGLYLGTIDPDAGSFTFDGWYTDNAFTTKYNFTAPVTTDLTLYAKWKGDVPTPIDLAAATGNNVLEKTCNYLNKLVLSAPAEYTLVLTGNISNPAIPEFKNANISLLLIGKGTERVISKTNSGNLFLFREGTLILGKNISITATGLGTFHLVYLLDNSKVIMKEGAKISDVRGASGNAGAVFVNSSNATFTMEGGEISNNEVERVAAGNIGAAVCVSWGKFYMKGGLISGNKAKTTFNTLCISGGVYINNWNQFHKTGGVIKDNTAVITAAAGAAKTGQQVFYSANNGNSSLWKKVDANLNATDNLTTDNVADPLWKNVD